MKRIIRLFLMAVMAACAFTALSVATASAEETKILPVPTAGEPLTTTANQEAPGDLLTTGGFETKCTSGAGSEEFTSANNAPKGKVTFKGCTGPLSTTCSSGATAGEIVAEGEANFWLALLMLKPSGSELIAALVFFNNEVKFTCVNKTKTVEDKVQVVAGCEAAQVLPESLNKLISKAHEEFSEFSSGESAILSVLEPGATSEKPCLPKTIVNGGAEELSALTGLVFIEKYTKNKKEITIELMNP